MGAQGKRETKSRSAALWKVLAGGLAMLALAAAAGAPRAQAAHQYTLDPEHSLTGGCATDEVDPVADPGCPYEAFPNGPSEPFKSPNGMATDSYGDLYVAVKGPSSGGVSSNPHLDVFDAEGRFLTEIATPDEPQTVAVDSEGYLYVYTNSGQHLLRYDPTPSYDPAAGVIAYEPTPTVIDPEGWSHWPFYASLAVNPENDHLFVNFGGISGPGGERGAIVEFGSGAEGNPLLDDEVAEVGGVGSSFGLAIDQSRGRIYATDKGPDLPGGSPDEGLRLIRVFELAPPHNLIETFDGSSLPEGTFVKCGFTPEICQRQLTIAVDEANGDVFAYDGERQNVIYELSDEGQYLGSIHPGSSKGGFPDVVVDNGAQSPNGALRAEGRYLWASASPGGIGHAFAFAPREECPPAVDWTSFAHVGESEALLEAEIEPCHAQSSYRIEYASAAQFAERGFEGARLAGEGSIPAGGAPVAVSAGATGLEPGGEYVFRVVAENALGEDEGQGSFVTYRAPPPSSGCPNEALRSGPSALLPDCRAYELVTPPDTNGLVPNDGIGNLGPIFLSPLVSTDGERVFTRLEGGSLPGFEGTGSLSGDPYLSTRGPAGWSTEYIAGQSSRFVGIEPGSHSPDLTYSLWDGVLDGTTTNYLRFPDGHSEPLGQGSLGVDPEALPLWISPSGTHILFYSQVQLEPGAPGSPEGAIYDRSPAGTTHVVSLLPGDVAVGIGPFDFAGASPDGNGVAFRAAGKLYLRYRGEETFELGEGLTFAGVAEGGGRVFYLKDGKLYAFDVKDGVIPFTASGEATVVNVSRDGTAAYLASTAKLTSAANPLGEKAKAGEQNLYLSRDGQISFVGILTEGEVLESTGNGVRGLGSWVPGKPQTVGAQPLDPSRSSTDGDALLFESRAPLTGYANEGHTEVYRYDPAGPSLACLSCNPTGAPASADATLQEMNAGPQSTETPEFPTWQEDRLENLTADGRRAFFETPEALVASDIDGLRDVYEWEAAGEGSCTDPGGCIYLVSSGRSSKEDFLYGVSESGGDAFILSGDLLDPAHDSDETASIYDARVGGGFAASTPPSECLGEACQPAVSPPQARTPTSAAFRGAGNVGSGHKRHPCRKGRRRVRRHGKSRCVRRRHPKHHHRHRARGKARHAGRSHR